MRLRSGWRCGVAFIVVAAGSVPGMADTVQLTQAKTIPSTRTTPGELPVMVKGRISSWAQWAPQAMGWFAGE